MKYMLLMQGTRKGWEAMGSWPKADLLAHLQFMIELATELGKRGELLLAEGLDVPANAKIVRAKTAGAPIVSDGPFAETKEFLAGFWLVEVPSLARAIEIAAKASTAPGPGGKPMEIPIEVRELGTLPDLEA